MLVPVPGPSLGSRPAPATVGADYTGSFAPKTQMGFNHFLLQISTLDVLCLAVN